MNYHAELTRAMALISAHPKVMFFGQGVGCDGTSMSSTFNDVPMHKRVEYPVAEELQMGHCIGAAIAGWLPICVFPRWNFVLRAADQLVNHLDRLPIYGNGYRPKVIIRVAVPSTRPFNPGPQHDDDFTGAFRKMLRTTLVQTLDTADSVVPAYYAAMACELSTILIEYTHLYRDARADAAASVAETA
jgi:pyruvate/2-oxoglutarate/acetoin dehydrogenase E1 component